MPENREHIDFFSLVARYLAGELSTEERSALEEVLRSDPEKQRQFGEFKETWETAGKGTGSSGSREGAGNSGSREGAGEVIYDLDAEWELLRRKLPREDFGVEKGRSILYYTWRIAAVLVVGLVLAFAWIYATRMAGTEVVVAEHAPVGVRLADGTLVVMNRDSRLRYPRSFRQEERNVYLSGEAWFDVARDTTRPFIIDADGLLVEVLGTSFNINAYRDNPTVEITVESGIVAMSSGKARDEKIVLRAGNTGTYHRQDRQLELIRGIKPNALSWKTRELYFDDTPLDRVAEVIGKVYDTEVVLVNPDLASCTITVTFDDQSLEAVLKVLEMTLDLEVSITDDRVLLDGEGCADQN